MSGDTNVEEREWLLIFSNLCCRCVNGEREKKSTKIFCFGRETKNRHSFAQRNHAE